MDKNWLEATFRNIVNICSDATGGDAAFDPKYGMSTLNEIRVELGLDRIASIADMETALDGPS